MSLIPSADVPEAAEPRNKGLILIGISKKENRLRSWKYTKRDISSFFSRSTNSFLQMRRRSCDEPPVICEEIVSGTWVGRRLAFVRFDPRDSSWVTQHTCTRAVVTREASRTPLV